MIRHVVMWKLKKKAEGASKEKNAEKMKLILEGLKINIEEIKNVEVGINITKDDEGTGSAWDVVLISDFEKELDYTMYTRNAHHKKAISFINSVIEERRFVDYKVDV